MKTNTVLGLMAMALISQLALAEDSKQPPAHCFAIAAPLTCQGRDMSVTLQPADCYHTHMSAELDDQDGNKIATYSSLSSEPSADGQYAYAEKGRDGFLLQISDVQGASDDNSVRFTDASGNEIVESGLNCSY